MVKKIGTKHCEVRTDFSDLIIPYNEISFISSLSTMDTPIMALVKNEHYGKPESPKASEFIRGQVTKEYKTNCFAIHMKCGSKIKVNLINFNGSYIDINREKDEAVKIANKMHVDVAKLHRKIFKHLIGRS